MRAIITNTLKKYHSLYALYFYVLSYMLKFLGMIIKSSKNEFLIVCSGGKKYGDNMKPVYEALLQDSRFNNWSFTWAFRNPENFKLPDKKRTLKCKLDTPVYYFHALRSKCWLTNVSVQRGLNFKNKGTFYINTWHGVPLKHIGLDIKDGTSFKLLKGKEEFDLICTMGEYDKEISRSAFGISEKNIKMTGYPRNDIMFKEDINTIRKRVTEQLNIDYSKTIILYAPTFRDYNKDKLGAFYFESKLSIDKFRERLGNQYILIVRAHAAIVSSGLNGYIDATTYPDVEDLLRISDILVTDYSGIMFDYALLGKPIICYAYDYEKYQKKRGLYVDYKDFIPFTICKTEDELLNTINDLKYDEECIKSLSFADKCGLIRNGATYNVVNAIYEGINEIQM